MQTQPSHSNEKNMFNLPVNCAIFISAVNINSPKNCKASQIHGVCCWHIPEQHEKD